MARVPSTAEHGDDISTAEHTGVHLKYYRVKVSGWAFNTEGGLQTGFYPAQALHDLYGEVKATSQPTANDFTLMCDPDTHKVSMVDPESRFTIIYGAKTDALTQQIHTFATTQETGGKLTQLMSAASGSAKFAARLKQAEKSRGATTQAVVDLAKDLRTLATSIAAAKQPADASKLLGDAAQATAKRLGSRTTLTTSKPEWSDEATKVYEQLKK